MKKSIIILISIITVCVLVISIIFLPKILNYNKAINLLNEDKYTEALKTFKKIKGYKDSNSYVDNLDDYIYGISLMQKENYELATNIFKELGKFYKSEDMLKEIIYIQAKALLEKDDTNSIYETDIVDGINKLVSIKNYKDTNDILITLFNKYKNLVETKISIKSDIQNDYFDTDSYIKYLSKIEINDDYYNTYKDIQCRYSSKKYIEGLFSEGTLVSLYCGNEEFIKIENKYEKLLTSHNWYYTNNTSIMSYTMYIIGSSKYNGSYIDLEENSYHMLVGDVNQKKTYFAKIVDNIVYGKEKVSDKYTELFKINSIDENSLKTSKYSFTFTK